MYLDTNTETEIQMDYSEEQRVCFLNMKFELLLIQLSTTCSLRLVSGCRLISFLSPQISLAQHISHFAIYQLLQYFLLLSNSWLLAELLCGPKSFLDTNFSFPSATNTSCFWDPRRIHPENYQWLEKSCGSNREAIMCVILWILNASL